MSTRVACGAWRPQPNRHVFTLVSRAAAGANLLALQAAQHGALLGLLLAGGAKHRQHTKMDVHEIFLANLELREPKEWL